MLQKEKQISIQKENITNLDLTGTYQKEEAGEVSSFFRYGDIKAKGWSQIIIKGYFGTEVPRGMQIMLYLDRINLRIWVNGQEKYNNKQDITNTYWDSFISDGITSQDTITMMITPKTATIKNDTFRLLLEKLCFGTKYALLQQQVKANVLKIGISFVSFMIGLGLLMTMEVLRFFKAPVMKGYLVCSLLLMTGAICTFINYDYITLMFPQAFLINRIDYLLQLFIAQFLLLYLKNYIYTEKYKKISNGIILFWTGVMVCYLMLHTIRNVWERDMIGSLILVFLVLLVLEIYFIIRDYFRNKSTYTEYVLCSILFFLLFTMAEVVHYLFKNIYWIFVFQIGLLIFALLQFFVLLCATKERIQQALRARELEKELIENQTTIMLSQIQPHFLYNSLTAIEYLCENNPKEARKALNQFSEYLRGNIASLKQKALVSFEKELKHIKVYLELEKMRFQDNLQVCYDVQTVDFMLPSLTVQPLVENAVKYGVGKQEEGGTVTIRVVENTNEYQVIIEDDGVGFEPMAMQQDGRNHIGIDNVRKRLQLQCNGILEIESEKEKGTIVRVKIPKMSQAKEVC